MAKKQLEGSDYFEYACMGFCILLILFIHLCAWVPLNNYLSKAMHEASLVWRFVGLALWGLAAYAFITRKNDRGDFWIAVIVAGVVLGTCAYFGFHWPLHGAS